MEHANRFLETQFQKIKTGELYPPMSHNTLNHALFTPNFLKMDVHEWSVADRLWHNSTN